MGEAAALSTPKAHTDRSRFESVPSERASVPALPRCHLPATNVRYQALKARAGRSPLGRQRQSALLHGVAESSPSCGWARGRACPLPSFRQIVRTSDQEAAFGSGQADKPRRRLIGRERTSAELASLRAQCPWPRWFLSAPIALPNASNIQ